MHRWLAVFVLTLMFTCAASAQVVEIQVEVQPAQVQIIQAQADRVAIMPGYAYNQNRLLQSDVIVVGRVVAMEPMDVEAVPAPGQPKTMYRIAQVQVTEVIHGVAKDTKMIRVGFMPQGNVAPNPGGINILPVQPAIQPAFQPGRRPIPGNFPMNLQVGQDGIFALSKHAKETFYVAPSNTSFVTRENNPNFENDLRTAKQLSKALANPVAALKAEDKSDRYVAAAVLITKYRANPTGAAMKSEPIDAAESKLILQALQGGDWTVGRFNAAVPNPLELFNQLSITQKDGYNPVNVRNQQDIATAMQKWLDENNGKFVIHRLVTDPNAKAPQPGPGAIDPAQPVPPNVRPPVKINPKNIKVQPLPIKLKAKVVPAPAPVPVPPAQPPELEAVPPPPAPVPARRE